jgi:glycosyltransferase involved in cell wall biosynthesis
MGLNHLIDALSEVRKRIPDVLLYIAGTGPLHEALQRRIDEEDLSEHVSLLGFLPEADLPFAYRAANVSVVPTVSLEGFGLITVESLAAGTPVLVTPVGGLPEVVSPLSSALVLEGSDVDHLATGMIGSLTGTLSLPSSRACRAYARARFSWPAISQQTRSVYETVLP